jgi:hypothetical protein
MTQLEKATTLLDNSVLFTQEQKEAWLELLPKMNEEELTELYSILVDEVTELKKEGINLIDDSKLEAELIAADHGASIEALKAAAQASASTPTADEFAQELKREVTTPELNNSGSQATQVAVKLAPMPEQLATLQAPPAEEEKKLEVVEAPSIGLTSLMDIKVVDDLKKIQTQHLRQGELRGQMNLVKSKIITLAQENKILPYYAVEAFEQSPLFKTYMTIGYAMLGDPNPNRAQAFEAAVQQAGMETLTLREFEAVADLRKQIEHL